MSGNNGQKRRDERNQRIDAANAARPNQLAATLAGKLGNHLAAMQMNVSNLGNTINATIEAQNRQAVTTLVIKELLVEKGLISLEELNQRILAKRGVMLTADGDAVVGPAVSGEKEETNVVAEGQETEQGTDRGDDAGQGGGQAGTAEAEKS